MSVYALVKALETACTALGATSIVFFVAWLRTRERAIRAETALQYRQPDASRSSDRIEAAVDAVALELERLAEGQRFVARVLSERHGTEPARVSAPPRSITPH